MEEQVACLEQDRLEGGYSTSKTNFPVPQLTMYVPLHILLEHFAEFTSGGP